MKKKIAIFVPNVKQGGTDRVAQRLANYFSSKDIIVTIFTMSDKVFYDLQNTRLVSLGFEQISSRTLRFLKRRKAIIANMLVNDIKVIISMGEYPNFLVSTLPKRFLRINRSTNSTSSLTGLKGLLIKTATLISQNLADFTIVPVKSLILERIFLQKKKKFRVIPNPVERPSFKIKDFDSRQYFLHIGQLVEQKNHVFLLECFAEYCHRYGGRNLILVGKGLLEGKIKEK